MYKRIFPFSVLDLGRPFLAQWDILPQVLVLDGMNTGGLNDRTVAGLKIKQFYFENRPATISTRQELLDVRIKYLIKAYKTLEI